MDEDHPCEGSRGVTAHEQVQWCPAWELWLCAQCRHTRNEAEFRVSLEERKHAPAPDWSRAVELIRL